MWRSVTGITRACENSLHIRSYTKRCTKSYLRDKYERTEGKASQRDVVLQWKSDSQLQGKIQQLLPGEDITKPNQVG
jgi:hypothetical protein